MTVRIAIVRHPLELIHHHAREDVGLVVDVVEDVLVEDVEDCRGHEEAADAHPEAVGEGDYGEGEDCVMDMSV
jgi:hypothetical protein